MATITWGLLAKSLVDPEKIEEAINRIVAEHNDDEEAHLGEGQALQSHKASEIIDHLVASIIADKIKDGEISMDKYYNDDHQIYSSFESLDGWEKSAIGVVASIGGVQIFTGVTINTVKFLAAESLGDSTALNWTKKMFFQTSVRLVQITNQLCYFGSGPILLDGTDNFFGFKISNGTLYAIHIKSDGENQIEYTTEITGITLTDFNVFRAVFNPDAGTIEFYVNGVLKATHSSNIPVDGNPVFFTYYLKNTAAENKYFYAKYLLYARGF